MNDLLFYALLAALLYYFFIYLPAQKSRPALSKPSTHSQATQTETLTEPELNCPGPQWEPGPELKQLQAQNQALLKDQAQKERTIVGLNKSYESLEEKFKQVKEELTKLSQAQQTDQSQTEKTLDQLIKSINKLSQELCP